MLRERRYAVPSFLISPSPCLELRRDTEIISSVAPVVAEASGRCREA